MICQLHEGLHLSRGCAACGRHLSLTFCRASVFKVALSGGCPEIMQLADAIQIVDTPDDSSIVYNSTWCSDCPVISMRPFHRSSAFLMPAYFFQPRSTWQLLRGHSVQAQLLPRSCSTWTLHRFAGLLDDLRLSNFASYALFVL